MIAGKTAMLSTLGHNFTLLAMAIAMVSAHKTLGDDEYPSDAAEAAADLLDETLAEVFPHWYKIVAPITPHG